MSALLNLPTAQLLGIDNSHIYWLSDKTGIHQDMLNAYQKIPDNELLQAKRVELTLSMEKIISQPGLRVICDLCGEEIMNEREVFQDEKTLCQGCAGKNYYKEIDSAD